MAANTSKLWVTFWCSDKENKNKANCLEGMSDVTFKCKYSSGNEKMNTLNPYKQRFGSTYKLVKISDKMERRFGVVMTPLPNSK